MILENRRRPVSAVGIVRIYLLLLLLQASAAEVGLFFGQSEAERSLWLGLSAPRIMIAGAFSLFYLILLVVTIKAFLDRDWIARQVDGFRRHVTQKDGLLPLAVIFLYFFVFGAGMILFFLSPLSEDLDTMSVIFRRTAPLLVWGVLACLESYLLLRLLFVSEFSVQVRQASRSSRRVLKILILLSFTITPLVDFYLP